MKTLINGVSIIILLMLSSCNMDGRKGTLTDEKITNYCNAYKAMRNKTPEILGQINENGENTDALQGGYDSFEKEIQDNGISDFEEFVKLNAQIGAIYSILQAKKGMEVSVNLYESSQDMFSDGENALQEQIDDPDVPEEAKEELRQAIVELRKGSKELSSSYKYNKFFADFTMEKVQEITGYIVNKNDIELVKKHEAEITDAYVGFKLPKGFDGKLPKFKMD